MASERTPFLIWPIILGMAGAARAEPAVLGTLGPTRPIGDYLEAVARPDFHRAAPATPTAPSRPITPRYPVRTPGLSPGAVPVRVAQLPQLAGRPLFLVGSDSFSRAWLAQHQARLKALGAVGLLVQAETARDLADIQALAPGVPISPVDGTGTAKALGLAHYPVLVSAGRIEQ